MFLCPSRSRPHNLQRLIDAYDKTHAYVKMMIRLDENDPRLNDYLKLVFPDTWITHIGPQVKMGGAMREAFKEFPDEVFYSYIGDDTIPRTEYWDMELAYTAGDWEIAYPNDLLQGEKSATHPVIGGKLLRAVGYWTLPCLTHLYTDTVWDHIGKELDLLRYREDVILEHCHWSNGKPPRVEIYIREFNGKNYHYEDQACFNHWKQNLDVSTLRKTIAESVKASSKSCSTSEITI